MPESIFDVVTEDVKGPHVAEQMPEAPMEKHKGYERKNLLWNCKISADLGNGIPGRDKAVNIDKFLQPDPYNKLIEENDNIDPDDCVVDNRVIFSWDSVTQRNHFMRCNLWVIDFDGFASPTWSAGIPVGKPIGIIVDTIRRSCIYPSRHANVNPKKRKEGNPSAKKSKIKWQRLNNTVSLELIEIIGS